MYRKTEDFLADWAYESASTIKIFKNISNEVLNKKNNENIRTFATLCWHITITLSEMLNKAGLEVTGPNEHSKPPETIAEIIRTYEESSSALVKMVSTKWGDDTLLEEVNMYGENWKKGVVLSVLIKHQAHHRGQLTVLMRLEGLTVPGVYGPSKEEWAQWNMPAMD